MSEHDPILVAEVSDHLASRRVIEAAGFGSVMKHLSKGPFGAMSAELAALPPEQNKLRTEQFKKILAGQDPGQALPETNGPPPRIAPHGFVPGRGVWMGMPEKSLFIPGISEQDLRALSNYFKQDAYVWGDGSSDQYRVQPTAGGEPYQAGRISEDLDILTERLPAAPGRPKGAPESPRQTEVKDERYFRFLQRMQNAREIMEYLKSKGAKPPFSTQMVGDASTELGQQTSPAGYPRQAPLQNVPGYSVTDGRQWVFRKKDDQKLASMAAWEDGYLFIAAPHVRYVSPNAGLWTKGRGLRGLLKNAAGDIQAENLSLLVPVSIEPELLSGSKVRRS